MSKGKLLIVEDEPIVALDLQEEVQELGYEVVGVAESADEALMIVQSKLPDCALMDIRITGSMDGIQTARALRNWYHVPSVFLTSYSDDSTLARAARVMPYGYLTKPFKSAELNATLRMALDRARTDAREEAEREQVTETFNGMPEGIITLSSKGQVRFMNFAAESLTGWNAAAAKGRAAREVLQWSPGQTNPVPGLIEWKSPQQGEWMGCTLVQPDGGSNFVDITLATLSAGDSEPRGYVLTLRDASERMRKQALEEAQNERPCFDHAPMAMMQLDAQGRIERVNEALLKETGIPAEKVLTRTLTDLNMDPDPRIGKELLPKLLKNASFVTAANQGTSN
jgi:PAS domain S-box-containing protein